MHQQKNHTVDFNKARTLALDNISRGIHDESLTTTIREGLFCSDMFYHPELKALQSRLSTPGQQLTDEEKQGHYKKLVMSLQLTDTSIPLTNILDFPPNAETLEYLTKRADLSNANRDMSAVAANVAISIVESKNNEEIKQTIESKCREYTEQILVGTGEQASSILRDYPRESISTRSGEGTATHKAESTDSKVIAEYRKELDLRGKEIGLSQEQRSLIQYIPDQASINGMIHRTTQHLIILDKLVQLDSVQERRNLIEKSEDGKVRISTNGFAVMLQDNPEKLSDKIMLLSTEYDISELTGDQDIIFGLGSSPVNTTARVTLINSDLEINFPKSVESTKQINHVALYCEDSLKSIDRSKIRNIEECASCIAGLQPLLTDQYVKSASKLFGYDEKELKSLTSLSQKESFVKLDQEKSNLEQTERNKWIADMLKGDYPLNNGRNNGRRYPDQEAASIILYVLSKRGITDEKQLTKNYKEITQLYCENFVNGKEKKERLEQYFNSAVKNKEKEDMVNDLLLRNEPDANAIFGLNDPLHRNKHDKALIKGLWDLSKNNLSQFHNVTQKMLQADEPRALDLFTELNNYAKQALKDAKTSYTNILQTKLLISKNQDKKEHQGFLSKIKERFHKMFHGRER